MDNKFEMSMMGEFTFFLWFQIKQMNDDIFLSQTKYANELVKKFGLNECKISKTPMTINANLSMDERGKLTDIHQYRVMIDNLLYIMAIGIDITFSICLCTQY
jgi:transcriptional regulator